MKGAISIAIVFIAVVVVLYMGISMISTIPEPEAGTDEAEIFEGLSKIVDISYKGYYVVLLIIIVLAIITAFKIGGKI